MCSALPLRARHNRDLHAARSAWHERPWQRVWSAQDPRAHTVILLLQYSIIAPGLQFWEVFIQPAW